MPLDTTCQRPSSSAPYLQILDASLKGVEVIMPLRSLNVEEGVLQAAQIRQQLIKSASDVGQALTDFGAAAQTKASGIYGSTEAQQIMKN